MKISIVVPAYNEEKLLPATLREIRQASTAFHQLGWETELIVCDNNSSDRTGELAQAEGAKVVFEPFNQIGRARNTGASIATGDWLVFIDADSHPSAALFGDLAAAIQTGRVVGGGATVRLEGHYPFANCVVGFWNFLSRCGRLLAGSFIFCQRAAFQELGGFDPSLFASEEIEFSKRLKRLARSRAQRVVILTRHPLLTSARKVHLYSAGEHLRFLARTIFGLGRTLRQREACLTWYDGRR